MTPQETVERTLALSRTEGCVVILTERSEANLRWANNSLTTNGAMRSRELTVVAIAGTGTGAASGTVTRSASPPTAWSPSSAPPRLPPRPPARPTTPATC